MNIDNKYCARDDIYGGVYTTAMISRCLYNRDDTYVAAYATGIILMVVFMQHGWYLWWYLYNRDIYGGVYKAEMISMVVFMFIVI